MIVVLNGTITRFPTKWEAQGSPFLFKYLQIVHASRDFVDNFLPSWCFIEPNKKGALLAKRPLLF
jgi:hypothetical protein